MSPKKFRNKKSLLVCIKYGQYKNECPFTAMWIRLTLLNSTLKMVNMVGRFYVMCFFFFNFILLFNFTILYWFCHISTWIHFWPWFLKLHDLFYVWTISLTTGWDRTCLAKHFDTFWNLNGWLHNSNNRLYSCILFMCDNSIVCKFNLALLWDNHLQITEAGTFWQCDVRQVWSVTIDGHRPRHRSHQWVKNMRQILWREDF